MKFQILTETQCGNFISSPFSIAMVLALAAYGSGSNTRDQLTEALNIPIHNLKFTDIFYNFTKIFNVSFANEK